MRDILRAAGYASSIYAENVHEAVRGEAEPPSRLSVRPGDLVLLHYSIWSAVVDRALARPARRLVVRYHNVTPRALVRGCQRDRRRALPHRPRPAARAGAAHAPSPWPTRRSTPLDLEDAGIGPREVLPILLQPSPRRAAARARRAADR